MTNPARRTPLFDGEPDPERFEEMRFETALLWGMTAQDFTAVVEAEIRKQAPTAEFVFAGGDAIDQCRWNEFLEMLPPQLDAALSEAGCRSSWRVKLIAEIFVQRLIAQLPQPED